MKIDYAFLKTHALSMLKQAQKDFNKTPNSTNWKVLTTAMVVHQQVTALRDDRNIGNLCERLSTRPFGDWPKVIVGHATGMTVRDILTQHYDV